MLPIDMVPVAMPTRTGTSAGQDRARAIEPRPPRSGRGRLNGTLGVAGVAHQAMNPPPGRPSRSALCSSGSARSHQLMTVCITSPGESLREGTNDSS